jgi:glycosyltransferase involved in cell wall biosynthesis
VSSKYLSKKLHILFISHYFYPEAGPAAPRITGLAEALVEKGYQVTVFTIKPNYPKCKISEKYKKLPFLYEEKIGQINIVRGHVVAKGINKISRFLCWISSLCSISSIIIKDRSQKSKYDIVISSSPPIFILLAGCLAKYVYKIPLVLDIRDIWPDVLIDSNQMKRWSFLSVIMRLIEKASLFYSNHILVVTPGKKDNLIRKGINPSKISILSNGTDEKLTKIKRDPTLKAKYSIPNGRFIVIYAGIFSRFQNLDIIIEAARILREKEKIHFLLLGDGPLKVHLLNKVNSYNLCNVKYIPYQDRFEASSIIAVCDLSIISLHENLKDSVPSKLIDHMAVGTPILLSAVGDSVTVLKKANAGIVLNKISPLELASMIENLSKQNKMIKQMGENGRNYVKKNCLRHHAAETFEKTLNIIKK